MGGVIYPCCSWETNFLKRKPLTKRAAAYKKYRHGELLGVLHTFRYPLNKTTLSQGHSAVQDIPEFESRNATKK